MNIDQYVLDKDRDKLAIELFRKRLAEKGASEGYIQTQIDYIFPLDGGFIERFNLLEQYLKQDHYHSLLVSGSAVGSELFVGIKRGFKEVSGTEIWPIYNEIARMRFNTLKNIFVYDVTGVTLPFENAKFSVIMSGHIIEHTMDPEQYLCEHFRVLKPGGLFFLEFPDRKHKIELHTGTISFERFPLFVRNTALRIMSSPLNHNLETRAKYNAVLKTLLPIGQKDVTFWLKKNNIKFEIIYTEEPHPGFKRMILRKCE